MARITRSGSKGVRRAGQSQSRAAGARRAKAKTSGLVDSAMGLLPLTEDQWSKVFMVLILGAGALLVATIANLAGVPAIAHAELTRVARDTGFAVRTVRVSGTDRMDESVVYALAMGQKDQSMPQVDIEQLRAELMELSWVKDARVSIQLPDTLAIDIVERKPHAVLQKPDHQVLIDMEGQELAPVTPKEAQSMLLLTGPGAARQVASLNTLFAAVPAIEAQVQAAEWVGNRRWNLTFNSGQVLALPEGKQASVTALGNFANLDGQYRLIGGKVTSFDMRNPPRIYMREPGRADRIELAKGGT